MVDPGLAWGILIAYLVIMLATGFYAQRLTTGLRSFLTGSSVAIGPWLIAVGYAATAVSMSGWVGNSALTYRTGAALLFATAPQAFVGAAAFLSFGLIMRNMARKLGVMTFPDYFAERYRVPILRQITAVIIVIFMIPYIVAIIKATSVSFQALLGVQYWVGVVATAAVVVIYMALGGYLADIFTDFIQGWLMAIGMVITLIVGFAITGGPQGLFSKLATTDPKLLEVPGPLGWGPLIGICFVFSVANWGQPQLIYRFFHFKDARSLKIAAVVTFFFMWLFNWAMAFPGLFARVLEPNLQPDLATVTFVAKYMHPAFAAFILTAGVAATMSTIDGVLLVLSTAFARDIYQKTIAKTSSDAAMLRVAQITTAIVGVICVVLALNPPDMLIYLTIFSFSVLAASFVPAMLAGVWTRWVSPAGAVASMVVGCLSTLGYYQAGQPFIGVGLHPALFGFLVSAIVLIVVSLVTKPLDQGFLDDIFGHRPGVATPQPAGSAE